MSGIAGIIHPTLTTEQREGAVLRMCGAMSHRGLGEVALFSSGEVTIGWRRRAGERQPLQTPDGRYTLVFDGALYNAGELRRELESHWVFQGDDPAEALLAAYARWGESCLDRLRGMFAFAIWDGI